VKPEKPVIYRTLDGDWLCPTCWWDLNRPSNPFYRTDLADAETRVCRGCDEVVRIEQTSPPEPCVFCDIIAGDAPVEWVLRPDFWPDAVAFIPLDPVTEGHCPIVPKIHVQDFAEDAETFAATARRASELMRFTPRAMNVLTTRGKAAGQEIMHLHLHLIPREHGDGIRLLTRKGKKL
jgi:histidine triad (HIT) family protein